MTTLPPTSKQRIAAVRRFSRFYTRQLGLLAGKPRAHPLLAHRGARALRAGASRAPSRRASSPPTSTSTTDISAASCAVSARTACSQEARAANDGRQSLISITAKGRKAFAPLNKGSHDQVAAMLEKLAPAEQPRVVGAMAAVETLLGASRKLARAGDHPAPASAGRHGLGHLGAWRDLRAGIRLGHHVRGAGRRRSPPSSSRTSILSASAAGSPSSTASASARCSSCGRLTRSPSSAC